MVVPVMMAVITTSSGCKVEVAQYMIDNIRDALEILHGSKDSGSISPHEFGIPIHHVQTGTHGLGQIRLIDHQHVALGDSRPTLSWNLVSTSNVDDVESQIGQLVAKVGSKVVATAFAYEERRVRLCRLLLLLCVDFPGQSFEGGKVGRDVLPNGSMWTSTSLYGHDAILGQGALPDEEFTVLLSENIVGDNAQRHPIAKRFGQLESEGSFPTPHGPADAHGEASLTKVAPSPRCLVPRFAIGILPGTVEVGPVRSYIAN